jgi:uncharacterized protein
MKENVYLYPEMLKGILFRNSPSAKFGFALIIILLTASIFYLIGIILSVVIFKWDIIHNPGLVNDISNPQTIEALKFFQLVSSTGLFIVPSLLFSYFVYPSVNDFLRLRKLPFNSMLMLSLLACICFLPFSNLLAWFNSFLQLPVFLKDVEQWMRIKEQSATDVTNAFLNVNSYMGLLYNILLIAVVPAIGEEFLFRGVLQRIFTEWFKSKHWGIWISAFIFSTIHLQFFGFLPRLFLGLFFGYILEATQNLWIPIAAHFINNLTGVLLSFFIAKHALPQSSNDFGMTGETWFYGAVGGIIGGLLFVLIIKKRDRIL